MPQNDLFNWVSRKAPPSQVTCFVCAIQAKLIPFTVVEFDSFYSGGVDGRIHAWSHDLTVKDPLYSIGAHNDRINATKYSYAMCL